MSQDKLNAGQLKHVAALFYDRMGLPPPWAGAAHLGDDFRLVNVGQLKQAFSFELRLARGRPPVQIPASWWDTAHAAWAALDSTQRAAGSTVEDFNGNGLSNLEEYLMHPARLLFDPDDKDGDRIPDVAEAASGGILSPLVFADAVEDHDNDGVMNYEEVLLGLNLNGPVTTGRADSLTDAEVLAWGLLAGVPLAPGTDAVRACWEAIDEAWIEQQGGMEFYGHWLDRTPASGVPAGWTAFQAEFWGPTSPDAASIQYPPTPIDLDGDDIPDMDRDGDGLPDLWEYRHELDLRGAEDAWDDPDGDTLVNLMEFANGTNPRLADTDGDGFSDAEEGQHGGDPRQGGSVPPVLVQIIGESAHTHYPGQTTPALAVRATQAGIARMGVEITFTLTAGNGVLSPATQAGGGSAASLTLSTGADGIAAVTYTAAAHAEQAQVQAAAAGMAGTHVFTVHVIPMPPIFAGWGAGGGTTGSATAPPSAPAATAAVAAASDGMLIRVRRKYESDESFPGRDFKNSPSEYLGPNGMDPASSGGLNMPFDNPNLAHHTELTLQWASAGPARSRTYLVLVFKGRDAYARWAIIDGVRVGAPDMVGSVTFAVDQNGMLAVTTSGNLSGYMEKAAGEASVAFTQEPPTSEDERFVISLLPVEIKQRSENADGTFGDFVAVSELRPTRWRNMFRNGNESLIDDPDQIQIRLPGLRSSQETFRLKLGVTGITGKSNSISKDEDDVVAAWQANDAEVMPLHLVTDSTDDKFSGVAAESTTQKDNYVGDRTHIVSLGATVELKIEGSETGNFPPIRIPVKGPDGKVEFRVFVLSPNGLGGGNQFDSITNAANIAHEVYEQIGVSMDRLSTVTAPFPEGLPSSIPLNDPNHELTLDECRTLVGLLPDCTDKSVIDVYYLPCRIQGKNARFMSSLKPGKGKYGVVLISTQRTTLTLAHELGHACNLPHQPDLSFWLMKDKGTIDTMDIYNSKRFSWQEENIIKSTQNAYYIPLH